MATKSKALRPADAALRDNYIGYTGNEPLPSIGTFVHVSGLRCEIIGMTENNAVVLSPNKGHAFSMPMDAFQDHLFDHVFSFGRDVIKIGDAAVVSQLLTEAVLWSHDLEIGIPESLPQPYLYRYDEMKYSKYVRPTLVCPPVCKAFVQRVLGLDLPTALCFTVPDESRKERHLFTAMHPIYEESYTRKGPFYLPEISLVFAGYRLDAKGVLAYTVGCERPGAGQIIMRRTLENEWVRLQPTEIAEAV